MSKTMKVIALLVSLLMLVSMLSACGGSSASSQSDSQKVDQSESSVSQAAEGEKVKLEWSIWANNPGEHVRIEEFNAQYMKKHPNIDIKFNPLPADGYSQKLLTSIAAGTAPDVFYVGDDIATYIKENRLVDLVPMMNETEDVKPEMFALNIFGAGKQGDKIYGIVPDCNPLVIYYNEDMIKSFGEKTPQEYLDEGKWDWNAFTSIATKAVETGKHGLVITFGWWAPRTFFLGAADEGGLFNPQGTKVGLDNPDKVEGIKFLDQCLKTKIVTTASQLPKGQNEDALFTSQQAAMVSLGRWAVPAYKDIKDFKWDIVPYPKTASGKEVKSGVAIAYISMNKDTKHPKEAFNFIREYTNKDGQSFRLKNGGNALASLVDPELNSIAEDGIVGHAKYFSELRNNGLGQPIGGQKYPEAEQAVNDALTQFCLGKIDVDAFIKQATEKGNEKLSKAN